MELEAPRDAIKRRILESVRCFVEAKSQLDPGSSVFDFSDQTWEHLKNETHRIGWLRRGESALSLKRSWSAFNCRAQAKIRAKIARANENGTVVSLDETESLVLELNNHDPAAFQGNNESSSSNVEANTVSTTSRTLQHNDGVLARASDQATQTEEETNEAQKRLTRRNNHATGK